MRKATVWALVILALALLPVAASARESVVVDRFEFVDGAFEWDVSLDGIGYYVTDDAGNLYVSHVRAQSAGASGWHTYKQAVTLADIDTLPKGEYLLWSQEYTTVFYAVVARYDHR